MCVGEGAPDYAALYENRTVRPFRFPTPIPSLTPFKVDPNTGYTNYISVLHVLHSMHVRYIYGIYMTGIPRKVNAPNTASLPIISQMLWARQCELLHVTLSHCVSVIMYTYTGRVCMTMRNRYKTTLPCSGSGWLRGSRATSMFLLMSC